jgi:hypothetical protein
MVSSDRAPFGNSGSPPYLTSCLPDLFATHDLERLAPETTMGRSDGGTLLRVPPNDTTEGWA